MSITLSELRAWTPTHLQDYANALTALATQHDSTLATVNASAAGQAWIGTGRAGQEAALAAHSAFVGAGSAQLTASAAAAAAGANALWGLQQQIIATVDAAAGQGFTVDEQNWNVTDALAPAGSPLWYAREPERDTVATTLAGQLEAFDAEEQATATGMSIESPIAPADQPLGDAGLNNLLLGGNPNDAMPSDYISKMIATLPGDSRYDQLRAELTALEHQPCTWGEFRNKLMTLVGSTAGTTIAASTAETGVGAAVAGIGAVTTLNAADALNQCLEKGLP